MSNQITVNGKIYTFPCTVTGEQARAIRDAAPVGMLEAYDVHYNAWRRDLAWFDFNSDEYALRISPDWKPEKAVEPSKGENEGDVCNRNGCDGVLHFPPVADCCCHVSPPCQRCIENELCCTKCDWTPSEEEPEPTGTVMQCMCAELDPRDRPCLACESATPEPAPKFPLTPHDAFAALAGGECVEMAGLIHRLKDRLEWWTTERNEWELASISTYDFHNMRIVPDPSVRKIRLATGQRVRIDGDDVHLLDGDGESVFCLMRDEMKEILNAMEESSND